MAEKTSDGDLRFYGCSPHSEWDPATIALRARAYGSRPSASGRSLWAPAANDAEWLRPLDVKRFLAEYWGRKPYHGVATDPDRFDSYFSFRALKSLISRSGVPKSQLNLIDKDQERIDIPIERGSNRIDTASVIQKLFLGEGSLIVYDLHRLERKVDALAQEMRRVTGHRIEISAYFTRKGGQTSRWHWDSDDFLILQVHGAKEWKLYAPGVRDPLSAHTFGPWFRCNEDNARVVKKLTMRRGDLLYMPAGSPHLAHALPGEDSLHLTIALIAPQWHNLVSDLYERALLACESDPIFRRKMDLGGRLTLNRKEKTQLRKLVETVFRKVDAGIADTAHVMRRGNMGGAVSAYEALWDSLSQLDTLDEGTALTTCSDFILTKRPDHAELLCSERLLLFPLGHQKALAFIRDSGRFQPRDLPGIKSARERVALARRLCQEGLISLA